MSFSFWYCPLQFSSAIPVLYFVLACVCIVALVVPIVSFLPALCILLSTALRTTAMSFIATALRIPLTTALHTIVTILWQVLLISVGAILMAMDALCKAVGIATMGILSCRDVLWFKLIVEELLEISLRKGFDRRALIHRFTFRYLVCLLDLLFNVYSHLRILNDLCSDVKFSKNWHISKCLN